MAVYLSLEQISSSFKRLLSSRTNGKAHLERTSALMYFLAFDAVCRRLDVRKLDFDHETTQGKANRREILLEFSRLVLLRNVHGHITQVSELGKIDSGGRDPDKRISSNFLTVPLKKASEQNGDYNYPKRPAPVLKMGSSATGMQWGIEYHQDWHTNLPKLLSLARSSTPFIDLAVFVIRNTPIIDDRDNLVDSLRKLIPERFSKDLSDFWIARIGKEKVFASHIDRPYSSTHKLFFELSQDSLNNRFKGLEKKELVTYIQYLENVLEENGVTYNNGIKN